MALYWSDKKVAIDIIDDPERRPFEGSDDWTVIEVRVKELEDERGFKQVCERLANLLGVEHYEMRYPNHIPDELGKGMTYYPNLASFLPGTVQTISRSNESNESIDALRSRMESKGIKVSGSNIWDGPIPDGSFVALSPSMKMATPEFFFLRKANQLPFDEAVALGDELTGLYETRLTTYSMPEGEMSPLSEPRITKIELYAYLWQIDDTDEGKRALEVLDKVVSRLSEPRER